MAMQWDDIFGLESVKFNDDKPSSKRFHFTGITLKGAGSHFDNILNTFDKYYQKEHLSPMTTDIVERYKTNKAFVKALGKQLDLWSDKKENFIGLDILAMGKKIINLLKHSSEYEIFDSRFFFVKRNHRKVIQKIYVVYADTSNLSKDETVHFKKYLILYQ